MLDKKKEFLSLPAGAIMAFALFAAAGGAVLSPQTAAVCRAETVTLTDNVFLNLVKYYAKNGDIERAMLELKKLRQMSPENVEYKKFEEVLRAENEKWSQAVPSPESTADGRGAAETPASPRQLPASNFTAEDDLPREVVEKNALLAKGRLRYVYELIGRGEQTQAISKLREITSAEPRFYEANSLLGDLYLGRKNYEDALRAFQNAINTRQDAETNYKLGVCYKALNDIDNAIIRFDTAVRMKPLHEMANLNLANIWRFRKNFKLAKGYYEQALKANSRLAEAHLGMADCIYNEGNIDEATRAYAFIVTNLPGEYSGYLGLARILIHNGQHKEAKVAILKAREIAPQNSQIYEMLGILAYSQKDGKTAVENFKRAVMLDSNSITAYQSLINILIDEKKFEEALTQIKNCLVKFPANPRLYYLAGIIYSGFKNDEMALKNLMESYKLDPENIEVILALAILQEKKFRYKESLEKYREALLIAEENKDMRYINNIHERIDSLEKQVEKYSENK